MGISRHPQARQRAAVLAAFFTQGAVFIFLTTRLPHLQERFGLSPATFSMFMLALVLCAGIGSLVGEKSAPRRGSAAVVRAGFLLMAAALGLLATVTDVSTLAVAMMIYGLSVGAVDAATNMQGIAVEHVYERPIMPTFFAAWTCGGVVATLAALALHSASFGWSVAVAAILPLVVTTLPFLRRQQHDIAATPLPVPWRKLLPVGVAMVLFYMVETAVTTWGPTYLSTVFAAGPALVSVATLPYLAASLFGRGTGDALTVRFGPTRLVVGAAVLGAVGLGLVTLSGTAIMAMVGFGIVGLGVAVVAPLSFSAAGAIARDAVPHGHPDLVQVTVDAIVARFNQFNYVGGLLGAVMTGAVGNDTLRLGFAVPMVLILAIAPLARSFRV